MSAPALQSTASPSRARTALVIGGGLAGIAAAIRLSEHGVGVTLIETRKRLGGRATSFVDPATNQVLDNCQHVLLGCCTNLLDLYDRLGVRDRIQWHSRLYFCGRDGTIDELEADDLPAPAHLTRSMMAFRTLTWPEKIAIARGMLAIMRLGKSGRAALDDTSFAQWLDQQGQPAGAIEKYWALVTVSAINELPERMAASHALQVFQEGFLANERSYVMGLPTVSLVRLYDEAERVITAAGGKLLLSTSAEGLDFDGGRVTGLRIDGGRRLEADAYVSALPFDRLAKVSPPAMVNADPRLQSLDRFEVSPIIGIHMWFAGAPGSSTASADALANERPPAGATGSLSASVPGSRGPSLNNASEPSQLVMSLPHLILMHSPLQWVFNKGWDSETGGQHIHGVVSAAHDLVDQPAEQILAMAVAELSKALPPIARARLIHGRVIKEKRATFSAAPGLEALRPTAAGAIPNLFLAGDWCRSGWPATMEGATRSGYLAAAAILGEGGIVPDLPDSSLYRLLARA